MIIVDENTKPNPIHQWFPTTVYLGYLNVDKEQLINLAEWARTQRWEDVGDIPIYTTRNGSQYITERPIWEYDNAPGVKQWWPEIEAALQQWLNTAAGQTCYVPTPKGSQFVLYREGGHQWPHFHASTWTAILGLRSRGTLIIQDPRPLATANNHPFYKEVIINPGQLFISPGYLIHSSSPAFEERDILVLTGD